MSAKSPKSKVTPNHPPYLSMAKEAIAATGKPVRGASRVTIAKYVEAKYGKVLGAHLKTGLRLALQNGVKSGALVQTKGSFRVAKAAKTAKVAKPKKPKAKKAKKSKKVKTTKKVQAKSKKSQSKSKSKPKPKPKKAAKKLSKKAGKKVTKPKKPAKKATKKVAASAPAPTAE